MIWLKKHYRRRTAIAGSVRFAYFDLHGCCGFVVD
jgi:hypothetical protein